MSFTLDSLVGIMTSCTSLFCVQPFYALKTAKQNQMKIKMTPRILWGGYTSNAVGDALSFSSQYIIYKNKESLTINHSIIGGLIGGVIANSSEQFMDKHRFFRSQGLSFHYSQTASLIKNAIGPKFFIRGLSGTCAREISYNYAWTTGIHSVEERLKHVFEINHPYIAKFASSFAAGILLTMINHPFDTFKSKVHNDATFGYLRDGGLLSLKQDYLKNGFKKTLTSLIQEGYRGSVFRAGIISFSLLLNEPLIKTYHHLFDDRLKK
jgi:hypothetical protein